MGFSATGRGGSGPGGSRFAVLAEVRAYWEGLRSDAALPRRDQIDPRGIAGALSQVFLVERIAPGIARFRLAGMGLQDLMGMDVRGMPLSAVFDAMSRGRLGPALETLFGEHAALDLWLEAERGPGRAKLEARVLLLPLVSSRGVTELALGCLAPEGEIGRPPRRFAISALLSETLVVAGAAPAPVLGFAEPPEVFEAPRPPRGKPHLRLVKSGD
jgi:hypothetical protein